MTTEFDKYAKNYDTLLSDSIKASGYSASYFDEQKIREVYRREREKSFEVFNFLNFGCGTGKSEKFIHQYFPKANIHSADVSSESLKIAAERNKNISAITYHHFEDVNTFQPDTKFDLIFVANVFHHIPSALHLSTFIQLRKLLTNEGKLYVFEHNPLNPLTKRAFQTCELRMLHDFEFETSKISTRSGV